MLRLRSFRIQVQLLPEPYHHFMYSFNSILASDEGFNSGNQSPEPEDRRRERRRNNRDGNRRLSSSFYKLQSVESKKRRRTRKDNNPISKI